MNPATIRLRAGLALLLIAALACNMPTAAQPTLNVGEYVTQTLAALSATAPSPTLPPPEETPASPPTEAPVIPTAGVSHFIYPAEIFD